VAQMCLRSTSPPTFFRNQAEKHGAFPGEPEVDVLRHSNLDFLLAVMWMNQILRSKYAQPRHHTGRRTRGWELIITLVSPISSDRGQNKGRGENANV
jgi:hypothetical protein